MNDKIAPTLYKPGDELESLVVHLDRIPHYLFRTFTPRSNGHTTFKGTIPTSIMTAAALNGYATDDVLGRDTTDATVMLKKHLGWKNTKDDNFTSWTSSPLFAIQHGVRKTAPGTRPDGEYKWALEHPSTIDITILDTRKLPRGCFLSTIALLEAFDMMDDPDIMIPYCHGEFLSQGTLLLPKGSAATITLQKLIDLGLHKLYTPLGSEFEKSQLWRPVHRIRQNWKPETPTDEELETAQSIAKNMTSSLSFRAVVMMNLLSIKRRIRNEPKILEAFRVDEWGE